MAESGNHEVTVTLSCQSLAQIAECSCRMTGYVNSDGSRLIAVLHGQDGTPVRLVLDKKCCTNST